MKSHVPSRAKTLTAAAIGCIAALTLGVGGAQAVTSIPTTKPTESAPAAQAAVETPSWDPTEISPSPYLGWSSWSLQATQNKDVNPQGYSSWLNEAHIIEQADAMVSTGLQAAGYEYINIDAAWYADIARVPGFDEHGRVTPNLTRFPNGMNHVADEIHERDLKAGIYTYAGLQIEAYEADGTIAYTQNDCTVRDAALKDSAGKPILLPNTWSNSYVLDFSEGNPCGYEYIYSLAKQFSDWGYDLLKLDGATPSSNTSNSYDLAKTSYYEIAAWRKAFDQLEWKGHFELSWAMNLTHMDYWQSLSNGVRNQGDVECYCQTLTTWPYVASRFAAAPSYIVHNQPGFYTNFDSLLVGNGAMDGLTDAERRTAATLWSIGTSPLYSGDDLTKLDDLGLSLLTNPEVLAQNQAGVPALPVSLASKQQVWHVKNTDGSTTVALFNLGDTEAKVTADFTDIGLGTGNRATVRDMWARSDEASVAGGYSATLPAHGSKLIKLVPLGANGNMTLAGDPILRAGEVREVTTTVTAPSTGATDVSHELTVPSGWETELVAPGATELGANETSTAKWVVRTALAGGDGEIGFVGHALVGDDEYAPEASVTVTVVASNERYLSDLRDKVTGTSTNGYGPVEWDMANGEQAAGDGSPLTLKGVTYEKGIGAHATSSVSFDLSGQTCTAFRSIAGVDDRKAGSVSFEVWGDGARLAGPTEVLRGGGDPFRFDVDITGVNRLELRAGQGGDGGTNDHADWALARIACGDVVTPDVDPSLTTSTTSVEAGADVDVALTGFAPSNESSIAELYVGDTRQGSVEVAADGTATATVTIPADAAPGSLIIEARQWGAAVDATSHPSAATSVTVAGADTTRPVVTLVSPTTTGPFNALSLQVDATDAGGVQKIVANIYQAGKLVKSTQTAIDGAATGTHAATVTLAGGTYTLKYNAHDLAGNVSKTGTLEFTVDATPPAATVKEGTSFTVGANGVYDLVSFKLHDAGKIDKVELNGVTKDLTNNAWSDVNYIKPGTFGGVTGPNTLVVYDLAGNTTTTTFTLN